MKRAKQLGSVIFGYNTLFIQEEFSPNGFIGESRKSAAGTDIVNAAADNTPYVTLESRDHGVIDETQKDAIIAMWRDFTTTQTLTYDDSSTDEVRLTVESPPEFTPLFEGACKYTAVIPLAKV